MDTTNARDPQWPHLALFLGVVAAISGLAVVSSSSEPFLATTATAATAADATADQGVALTVPSRPVDPATPRPERVADDPEAAALHPDPLDDVPPEQRVAELRAALEDVLAELDQDPTPDARAELRLRAATALTQIRADLPDTPQGRQELLDYAVRFRATAG